MSELPSTGLLPITIAQAVKGIQANELVLPAIQREFVWEGSQIVSLFDSIMRGYPIGSFLSWKISTETADEFKFYGFIRDYHEKDNPHCPVLDLPVDQPFTAVLDGQQRLTALNIGLRGSFAPRLKGRWWNNPKSYPKTRLYLNVLTEAEENELGLQYDFRLLREPIAQPEDGSAYWYPVFDVLKTEDVAALMSQLAKHQLGNNQVASKMIGDLWTAIHKTGILYFYEETNQDVERVLDIFIRVNSGGTTLSYSDLLLSIATAQWSDRDARELVHSLVDELNSTGQGFQFSKDVVLKSGLVLIGVSDIGFKVKNFNHENMQLLKKEWDAVAESLGVAVGLLSDFGLSDATLTADSVLVPIAYYIHRRGLTNTYRSKASTAEDRDNIRGWVMRSLVKQGIWGSGLDTLLRDLREVIDAEGAERFPREELESRMAARGKALSFTKEEIEDLVEAKYGLKRTFPILALLFPHVDTRNVHHIDHVYPRSLLSGKKLKAAGLEPGAVSQIGTLRDQLSNLALLEGPLNIAKSDKPPGEWARQAFPGEKLDAYLERNELPPLPENVAEFEGWFELRREALVSRLALTLGIAAEASTLEEGE